MSTTVSLYTTALDHLETLNINQIEVTHTAELGKRFDRAKVRTNLPHDLQSISVQEPDLIARLQADLDGDEVDEVCRIDYVEWTYRHSISTGSQGTSYAQFELTPLHSDAQQIVKAVLDRREQEKRSNTIDLELACSQAMSSYLDTLEHVRLRSRYRNR